MACFGRERGGGGGGGEGEFTTAPRRDDGPWFEKLAFNLLNDILTTTGGLRCTNQANIGSKKDVLVQYIYEKGFPCHIHTGNANKLCLFDPYGHWNG